MTSYLIDINVWLSLSWGLHPFSPAAHRWLSSLPPSQTRLLFCRITQLGLLRLLTNRMVMGASVQSASEGFEVFDRWMQDPRVEFATEAKGLGNSFRQTMRAFPKGQATKLIMDAYLVAFAEGNAAALVTFDKGLARIAQRRRLKQVLLASGARG